MITTVFICFYMCLMRFDPIFFGVKLLQSVSICLNMLQVNQVDSVCFMLFSRFSNIPEMNHTWLHFVSCIGH